MALIASEIGLCSIRKDFKKNKVEEKSCEVRW